MSNSVINGMQRMTPAHNFRLDLRNSGESFVPRENVRGVTHTSDRESHTTGVIHAYDTSVLQSGPVTRWQVSINRLNIEDWLTVMLTLSELESPEPSSCLENQFNLGIKLGNQTY